MDAITYRHDDGIATVTIDDGKANALSPEVIWAVDAAFDRAEDDDAIVVLRGRAGVFSGGFDLRVLGRGGHAALSMVRAGFELAERVLAYPRPVVAACAGHAIAMGAFLLLSADYRVGPDGDFRFMANEVAIGLTMPLPAIEILRLRLIPSAFQRAAVLSEPWSGPDAVAAGWLDEIVAPDAVEARADAVARTYAGLDAAAFRATKVRARRACLDAVRTGIAADFAALRPSA